MKKKDMKISELETELEILRTQLKVKRSEADLKEVPCRHLPLPLPRYLHYMDPCI